MSKTSGGRKIVATNKRAYHNYLISEKIEAGLVLKGCEVKSIRDGHVSIAEAFAKIDGTEVWLHQCHIRPYAQAAAFPEDPMRPRKCLLHRREINRLVGQIEAKGMTVVPLSIYFARGRVKIELGVAKPKKLHDKRDALKEKALRRELRR